MRNSTNSQSAQSIFARFSSQWRVMHLLLFIFFFLFFQCSPLPRQPQVHSRKASRVPKIGAVRVTSYYLFSPHWRYPQAVSKDTFLSRMQKIATGCHVFVTYTHSSCFSTALRCLVPKAKKIYNWGEGLKYHNMRLFLIWGDRHVWDFCLVRFTQKLFKTRLSHL